MATPVFIQLCNMILNDVLHVVKESLPDVAGVVSLSPVLEVTDAPKVTVIPLSLTLDVFDRGTQAQNASVLIELTGYVGTSEISAYSSYFEAVEKLLKLLPFATYDIDDNHFKPVTACLTTSPAIAYTDGGDANAYGFKSSISFDLRRFLRWSND